MLLKHVNTDHGQKGQITQHCCQMYKRPYKHLIIYTNILTNKGNEIRKLVCRKFLISWTPKWAGYKFNGNVTYKYHLISCPVYQNFVELGGGVDDALI